MISPKQRMQAVISMTVAAASCCTTSMRPLGDDASIESFRLSTPSEP